MPRKRPRRKIVGWMRPPTTIRNSGLAPSQVGTRILGCPGRPARSEHARDFGGSYLLALTSGDAPRVPPRCLSGGRNGWTSGVVLDQLALHHFRCDLCLEHHGADVRPGRVHRICGCTVLHSFSVAKASGNASRGRHCPRWRVKPVRGVAATFWRNLCLSR
jgi:hypothetical protein